ncbi:hypothetical protein SCHPADRAFT_1002869 [Schizopora paradoxa]|uniref:BTB domain-containing protein n=1 Tax=Schizopora paradoxa TaxID=27342 RepID=A0A0H2R162_9AGAM|nr:hypothetical protein SCHPADRAFT_1002869 [Schizopora paradoxa]
MDSPQPYADLWFADGSVVLKTDSCLFRVHKTMLARESTVFKDMFAFPVVSDHPEENEEKVKIEENEDGLADSEVYEGLPVVPLIDDDETAVIHLLTMIYKPNYTKVTETLLKLPCAAGLFKLSNKYQFISVEDALENELKVAFPQNRSAFGQAESTEIRHALLTNDNLLPLLPMVQDAGLAEHFPSLFYCCSQYSIPVILAECLDPNLTELLLSGREEIKRSIHRHLSEKAEFYHRGMVCCKLQSTCRPAAFFAEVNTMCQFQKETVSSNGGDFFTMKYFDKMEVKVTLCDECKKSVMVLMSRMRDDVWASLPEIFELHVAD